MLYVKFSILLLLRTILRTFAGITLAFIREIALLWMHNKANFPLKRRFRRTTETNQIWKRSVTLEISANEQNPKAQRFPFSRR